tara:strand:- start:5771 stop:6205 length:435 start_codon:yes stop_codon:yes gene_type:complete
MTEKFTVRDFFNRFRDHDARLEHVMQVRFGMRRVRGACGCETTFHKITGRNAYARSQCGNRLYPCAGTIFEKSRTSLQLRFYAIFLFVTTRHGVSGKELQRIVGVTYRTAWRVGEQIRILMTEADGFEVLRGHIEPDGSYCLRR